MTGPSGRVYGTLHMGAGERWTTHITEAGAGAYMRWVDGRTFVRIDAGWRELCGARKWLHQFGRFLKGKRS